jgi:nitronate monooxygenase
MVLDQLQSPVVLAPLAGGPSTPELAAAVSNAGGLGFLATGYLKAADVAPRLHAARQLTAQPLGVNVFAQGAPADPSAYRAHVERFRIWASRHGAEVGEPRYDDDDWEAKIDLLASSPPAVVSFTFGRPPQDVVERLHDAGSEVWVTITSPEEAHAAAAVGADVLVVQGAEAGGHRGSFDNRDELPIYGLLPLLDLVSAAVTLPLVASGGIATGRALAAVLCAGASAAQIGTAFMLAPEAGTNAAHREALRARGETVLTRAFTGRLARGIRNEFIAEHQDAPAAYPELHYLTSPMRKQAREQGDVSRINLWAGEAHELAVERPAAETVRELTASASAALESALEAQRTRARSQGASDAGASDPLRHPRAKALAREWYEAWNAHDLERARCRCERPGLWQGGAARLLGKGAADVPGSPFRADRRALRTPEHHAALSRHRRHARRRGARARSRRPDLARDGALRPHRGHALINAASAHARSAQPAPPRPTRDRPPAPTGPRRARHRHSSDG